MANKTPVKILFDGSSNPEALGEFESTDRIDAAIVEDSGEILSVILASIDADLTAKLVKTQNLADLDNVVTARTNLGVTDAIAHVTEDTKHRLINDAQTASNELWSSSKIDTEISAITDPTSHIADDSIHFVIDDNNTEIYEVWSAFKTNSVITAHTNAVTVHRLINDSATTSTTELWSANKIYGHTNDSTKHRLINDSTTSSTTLWSSTKINTELSAKASLDDAVAMAIALG